MTSKILHRDQEFDLLNAFLTNDPSTCTPVLMIHGYKSCGKSLVINEYLKQLGATTSIVRADTYLTSKIFLHNCLRAIRDDSGIKQKIDYYDKGTVARLNQVGESFYNFQYNLEKFIQQANYTKQHFLIIDKVENYVEDYIQLVSSFVRMRDWTSITNICVIFISGLETPHDIVTTSIPHIYFKPYTEQQVVEIFQANQFCNFGDPELDVSSLGRQFWNSFTQVIVDSFFEYTGPNMSMLIDICFKKWPQFIDTIKTGEYSPNEFLKVYRENRDIFQDDNVLSNSIVTTYSTSEIEKHDSSLNLSHMTNLTKFILIASYLASYIEPRNDIHYFASVKYSKLTGIKKPSKRDELKKKDMDNKLFQASYFDLERLYAILVVIYRNESKSFNINDDLITLETEADVAAKDREISNFSLAGNTDLHAQLRVLLSRGLLFRQITRDILQPRTRWRCNLEWDVIKVIAKDLNFPLQNYIA